MFWKCFLGVVLQVFSLKAYVIDRHTLVPDKFVKFSANLSRQSSEVTAGLFEGDIAISNEDYEGLRLGVNFIKFPDRKWPNKIVPYVISSLYSSFDGASINKAIRTLNSLSCLKFKPYVGEKDHLLIWPVQYPEGCYSFIGRMGGVQILSLKGTDTSDSSCLHDEGTPIHELLHAAGIFHEQSRADRDNYVEIIYENIVPGFELNFVKQNIENTTYPFEYDYNSVMHYGGNYFSIDAAKPTIKAKIHGKMIGQRMGMSKFDCLKLNVLYDCFEDKKKAKKYQTRCLALGIDS